MYTVISSDKDKEEGVIHHIVQVPDKDPETYSYSAVIGGMAWPNNSAPGYYLIAGQLHNTKDYRDMLNTKPVLNVLVEFESEFAEQFVNRLIEDAKILLCDTFYCDMGTDWEGFVETFWSYSGNNVNIGLVQAPYIHNFHFGSVKIGERIRERSLSIPKDMIVRQQIERMEVKDLREIPEINFYAVNALRHLVCGVERYSPGPVPEQVMALIQRDKRRKSAGFMAS
jgi:hypothetical protein